MEHTAVEKVVAFIDLGTNSIRSLIVRLNPNHSYTVLTKQKEMIRLGEGEFEHDLLLPEAMKRAVLVSKKFVELAKGFGAREIYAVATSATREAHNQDVFLKLLKQEADLDVHVISGAEEARLIYLGVSSGIDIGSQRTFFVDIGGGSTEIIVGDQYRYGLLRSLKLGAIRLTNRFFGPEDIGPVSEDLYQRICRYVRNAIILPVQKARTKKIDLAFGSSGTIQNLAEIACQMREKEKRRFPPSVITHDELQAVIARLCAVPLEERRKIPGINADRADIIVAGAAILDTIMHELEIAEIRVSDRSLRDGLLVDYLSKTPGSPYTEKMSVRTRSVHMLGRACRIDIPHAEHVARLAFDLFDSSRAIGLHDFGEGERELLEYAAYLHDIGQFISFSGHHLHSKYIIENAKLLGFNEHEIILLAHIARYHRKRMPRKNDKEFNALDPENQHTILVLSTFLRLAEHLDRSHAGLVTAARFTGMDFGVVSLEVIGRADCSLEVWALEADIKAFERAFCRTLDVTCRVSGESGSPA
ncbi:MAG: Ppx/GppA phosphatase family protein [Methanomicrobiaceae archaeon]|nr:Ppx/GppA phosphatase family protein [Methanomicrobiaceae archaeon]